MHNYICKACGAYLDPGESCDCKAEQEKETNRIWQLLSIDKNGQVIINFGVRAAAEH